MVEFAKHTVDPFSALAHPIRRAIVARLAIGDATVSELAEPFDVSLEAISKHTKILARAGIIQRTRVNGSFRCSLVGKRFGEIQSWLTNIEHQWIQRLDNLAAVFSTPKK